MIRHCRHYTADEHQQQPGGDHRFAPDAITEHAEGNLKNGLHQAVDTDGKPDEQWRATDVIASEQRKHRQDQKQTHHSDDVDQGQRPGRTTLGRVHRAPGSGLSFGFSHACDGGVSTHVGILALMRASRYHPQTHYRPA